VNGNLDRRRFVQLAALSGAAALAGCGTAAPLGDRQPVRLGYVSPKSGPLSAFGEADGFVIEQAKAAFRNGLEIGGRTHPVDILVRDSRSDPERARAAARDLITRDQVENYAARKHRPRAEVERWLAPNLGYDPQEERAPAPEATPAS
jgi:branched-chain amino acid transport system substrate-binding protein